MASAVDSRLAYARLLGGRYGKARLPTANRGSNNSYTTSWDTTLPIDFWISSLARRARIIRQKPRQIKVSVARSASKPLSRVPERALSS